MKRGAPLKRTPFKRKPFPSHQPTVERELKPLAKATRRGTYAGATGPAIDKERPVRSPAYRRLVASLACWMCGIQGHSQCAHADEGKGLSIKSDDRTSFPLCGPRGVEPGCHYRLGSTGEFSREARRQIEREAGRDTRAAIMAAGKWPASVPQWKEQE